MSSDRSPEPTTRRSSGGAPPRADLPVRLRERYELLSEAGHGGLGRVWKARDLELGRVVALKEVVPRDDAARARFVREALITARLEHPAIVPVHEAGQWDSGEPFYVMKLVSGRTLAEVAKQTQAPGERLALLPGIIAVADAIAYAHAQGVMHRDLKPSNVIVGDFGETVVIDWGLAKPLNASVEEAPVPGSPSVDSGVTQAGTVLGTPSFMAPEQARGDAVDERTDVYSLGGLLYFVLSGKPPVPERASRAPVGSTEQVKSVGFEPPAPLRNVEPGVSPELADIVHKAMAFQPGARYATAAQLAQDLKRFQTGQLVAAHRYSPGELLRRWLGRHRGLAAATLVFVALAAVGAAAFVAREQRLRRAAERERDRADQKTLALLEEQGRAELAGGHPFRAAVLLVEAYRKDPESLALRWLVSQATRSMDRLERRFTGHPRDIPYVAFSFDGTRFVTASTDGSARVWTAEGDLVAELAGGDKLVDAAVFSPDGSRVAAAGNLGVHIYDARGGAPLHSFDARGPYRVWFTPDGRRLVVGMQSGELRLLDAESGAQLGSVTHHHDRIDDLAFSPDGARFAVASWDGVASVWDVASFAPIFSLADHEAELSSVTYSRDGRWLITVESDVYVHVRRAEDGTRVRTLRLPEGARFSRASFSPDGLSIVVRSHDGVARIYQAASGALLDAFDAEPFGKLMSSALSPDGRRLVTTGVAGSIHIWRVGDGGWRLLDHPLDRGDYAESEYAAEGAEVMTGEEDGTVDRWDAKSGAPLGSFRVEGNAFAVVPAGQRVAVVGTLPANLPPGLWDPRAGRRVASLEGPKRLCTNAAVSADGASLALTSYDGTLRFYDAATGAATGSVAFGDLRLTAVAFRPDGLELAVTDENGRLHFIDRAAGRAVRQVQAHPTWIQDVEYSRDGARVVTAGRQDHQAKIWDAASGAPLVTLVGHRDNLMRASFSHDGALVATAAMDHTARVWDAKTGDLLRTIPGPCYSASFHPGGAPEIFTTGNHGYAAFWDLHVDARSPDELAAWIAQRSPWQLVDGRLRLRD